MKIFSIFYLFNENKAMGGHSDNFENDYDNKLTNK